MRVVLRRTATSRIARTAVVVLLTITTLSLATGTAAADPSANDWYRLRVCESSNNYQIDTGNTYYGAYQFSKGTWEWVGGTGLPSDATPAEQDYRALILYRKRGWSPWPGCSNKLGLVDDGDAASGVMPPTPDSFNVPYAPVQDADGSVVVGGGNPAPTEPAGPNPDTGYYASGLTKPQCHVGSTTPPPTPAALLPYGVAHFATQCWQWQMGSRGDPFQGTAYFGNLTLSVVTRVQQNHGITGEVDSAGRPAIGPKTWAAAWAPVNDVAPSNVHYDDIAWMVEQGIAVLPGASFEPQGEVTRGAMTAFLFRLMNPGATEPACDSPFPDVTSTDTYCGYIQWASDSSIVFGYQDGRYHPDRPVRRAAMAAFFHRTATNDTTRTCSSQAPFPDVSARGTFCGAITWFKNTGVTRGYTDGGYQPATAVTRQVMASFLHRTANRVLSPTK